MSTAKRIRKLTVQEVCDLLRISRATFYGWRRPGRGPRCVKLPNGALRVREDDLEAWLPGATAGLLTLAEVLDDLGVASSTFHDWRAKGTAPECVKLPNGGLRFVRSTYAQWLKEHTEDAA